MTNISCWAAASHIEEALPDSRRCWMTLIDDGYKIGLHSDPSTKHPGRMLLDQGSRISIQGRRAILARIRNLDNRPVESVSDLFERVARFGLRVPPTSHRFVPFWLWPGGKLSTHQVAGLRQQW
jgi:hypothetical protein